MDRLIKKVNRESWNELKAESARHGMRMGEFLEVLLEEHKEKEKKTGWDYIRKAKRRLSEEQIEKMKKVMAYYEKVYGFEEA